MPFDRDVYFAQVKQSLFGGELTQDQVDGQNYTLDMWEQYVEPNDLRWLAYGLSTALHETASTMMPIAEYGKGAGYEYGTPDPETGQTYYGRGYVQTTWRENYARADKELGLEGDESCEWHADNQLVPLISAATQFKGMYSGWFRSDDQGKQTLPRYFHDDVSEAFAAREIINGDKTKVPSWSNGVSIGNLIAGYYEKFLAALEASEYTAADEEVAEEAPRPPRRKLKDIWTRDRKWKRRWQQQPIDTVPPSEFVVRVPPGTTVWVNGQPIEAGEDPATVTPQ